MKKINNKQNAFRKGIAHRKNAIIKSLIVYVFSIINNKINTIIETKKDISSRFIISEY